MRGAAIGVALAVLAAACGVVPPPGSRQVVAEVTNTENFPVLLTIESPNGVNQGSVQPASLPAGFRGTVTFFLPPGDDWSLKGNGVDLWSATDLVTVVNDCQGVNVFDVGATAGGGYGCGR